MRNFCIYKVSYLYLKVKIRKSHTTSKINEVIVGGDSDCVDYLFYKIHGCFTIHLGKNKRKSKFYCFVIYKLLNQMNEDQIFGPTIALKAYWLPSGTCFNHSQHKFGIQRYFPQIIQSFLALENIARFCFQDMFFFYSINMTYE